MKTGWRIIAVSLLLAGCLVASGGAQGPVAGPSGQELGGSVAKADEGAEPPAGDKPSDQWVVPPSNPHFELWIDPLTGKVKTLGVAAGAGGGGMGEAGVNINGSFTLVSAVCPDCGTGCPPLPRTVTVVLEATAPVAGGFGISGLAESNYASAAVTGPQKNALAVGQTVTLHWVGDVGVCSVFSIFFDICSEAPASPTGPCI